MNLAEAWEAGSGIAVCQFHGMNIIVKYVDEQHVGFKFGTEQTGYKHVPLSPLWAFGGWLKDLGIKPEVGWEPGKDNDHGETGNAHARNKSRDHRRHSQRRKSNSRG